MLNREPMWLKFAIAQELMRRGYAVSVLNREPMWLKFPDDYDDLIELVVFQCSTVSRCG